MNMPATANLGSETCCKTCFRHLRIVCTRYSICTQPQSRRTKPLTAQDGKQNWLFKAMRAFSTRNQLVQVVALAWRLRDGEEQVCLVTTRSTGRWILPKDWPEKDLSHAEAAAREA